MFSKREIREWTTILGLSLPVSVCELIVGGVLILTASLSESTSSIKAMVSGKVTGSSQHGSSTSSNNGSFSSGSTDTGSGIGSSTTTGTGSIDLNKRAMPERSGEGGSSEGLGRDSIIISVADFTGAGGSGGVSGGDFFTSGGDEIRTVLVSLTSYREINLEDVSEVEEVGCKLLPCLFNLPAFQGLFFLRNEENVELCVMLDVSERKGFDHILKFSSGRTHDM